jgi:hypothetical protein
MIQATYSVGESIKSTGDYDLIIVLVFIIFGEGDLYGC